MLKYGDDFGLMNFLRSMKSRIISKRRGNWDFLKGLVECNVR